MDASPQNRSNRHISPHWRGVSATKIGTLRMRTCQCCRRGIAGFLIRSPRVIHSPILPCLNFETSIWVRRVRDLNADVNADLSEIEDFETGLPLKTAERQIFKTI